MYSHYMCIMKLVYQKVSFIQKCPLSLSEVPLYHTCMKHYVYHCSPTAGETQYTALYQFPCFTSDFQRAGQLVQLIFTLEW